MRRDSRYVIVQMRGQLGNQLFEFAAGTGIARALDADLRFDSTNIRDRELVRLPQLIGDRYREATPRQMLRTGRWPEAGGRQAVFNPLLKAAVNQARAVRGRTPAAFYSEVPSGKFIPELLHLDLPVHILHDLQSMTYWEHLSDEIFDAIRFPADCPTLPTDLNGPTIAVSFRRTDYDPRAYLSLDYYERAIARMGELVDLRTATLVLFSEDIDFLTLAEPWLGKFATVFNAYDVVVEPIPQLSMIADCDHSIMANSTFAWWGAWLGDQRHVRKGTADGRVVIVPDTYFLGDGRTPEQWHVLEAVAGQPAPRVT